MKKSIRKTNIWLTACLCGLLSVLFSVMFSLIGAKFMEKGILPVDAMRVSAAVILGLSSVVGAMTTALIGRRKVMLLCLISATVFFLALAILNGVLQKGEFCRIGETAGIIYAVSIVVGLLTAGKRRRYG